MFGQIQKTIVVNKPENKYNQELKSLKQFKNEIKDKLQIINTQKTLA